MNTFAGLLLGLLIPSLLLNLYLVRTVRGSYQYAVRAAEHYGAEDIMNERAIAYSDMATVITLDGKADPKWELGDLDGPDEP